MVSSLLFSEKSTSVWTGDASASRTSDEAEVDTRIHHVLDCEDPGIVCDLRELNEGQPEKYTKFWEERKKYLENVAELVVQERRHVDITYLVSALSVRDLLTEVARRCDQLLCLQRPGYDTSSGRRTLPNDQLHSVLAI